MKQSELQFLQRMLDRVGRKPYESIWGFWETEELHPNQWAYYLRKWADKGWYEYGVSLRSGWFTLEGIEYLSE